jgi:hypothetical protein
MKRILLFASLLILGVESSGKRNEKLPEMKLSHVEAEETSLNKYEDVEKLFDNFKKLYSELLAFKEKPDFKKYGFGAGGPYRNWLLRVVELKNNPNSALLSQKGVLAGELESLGLAYVGSQGKETDVTKFFNNAFKKAISKKQEDNIPASKINRLDEIKKNYKLFGEWRIKNDKAKMDYNLEIYKKGDDYVSVFKYDPRHDYTLETLQKNGNRYYIKGDKAGGYYMIDEKKGMSMHDKDGNLSEVGYKCYNIK